MTKPKRLLFDHFPKSGGSSVTDYVKESYPFEDRWETRYYEPLISVQEFKNLSQEDRWKVRLVTGHCTNRVINYVHPETYRTTILREPVGQALSHYQYILNTPNHFAHSTVRHTPLEVLLADPMIPFFRNSCVCHFSGWTRKIMNDNPKEALERAKRKLNRYHLVGRFQDLVGYCNQLKEDVGLLTDFNDRRLNVTKNKIPDEEVSLKIRDQIQEINQLDMNLWNWMESKNGRS